MSFPVPMKSRYRRMDDERLAGLVGAGDACAFEALYDRHHAPLLAFCRHMLGNRDDGEDALQQAFLRAHQALAGGRAPDRVRPWLFAIARNRCLTLIAARRDAALPADDIEPSFDGLAADVERRADLRELVSDLGRLPSTSAGAGAGRARRPQPPRHRARHRLLAREGQGARLPGAHDADRRPRRPPDAVRRDPDAARDRAGGAAAARRAAPAPAPVRSLRGLSRRDRAAAHRPRARAPGRADRRPQGRRAGGRRRAGRRRRRDRGGRRSALAPGAPRGAGGGVAGGAVAAGGVAVKALVAKAAVVAAIAAGGGAAVHDVAREEPDARPRSRPRPSARRPAVRRSAATAPAAAPPVRLRRAGARRRACVARRGGRSGRTGGRDGDRGQSPQAPAPRGRRGCGTAIRRSCAVSAAASGRPTRPSRDGSAAG